MQNLVGLVRRCADDYGMLQPGDRVAVGVSGGKDSLTLLVLLAALRKYHPSRFDLHAVTVDMGLAGMDFTQVEALCHRLEVPYTRVETQIAPIIFDYRQEKNPCSMCAKMRRGALNQALLELGCNKVALGHHYDDAVETFFLSLFYEGGDQPGPHRRHPDSAHAVSLGKDHCPLRGKRTASGGPQPLPGGQKHQEAGGQGPGL